MHGQGRKLIVIKRGAPFSFGSLLQTALGRPISLCTWQRLRFRAGNLTLHAETIFEADDDTYGVVLSLLPGGVQSGAGYGGEGWQKG